MQSGHVLTSPRVFSCVSMKGDVFLQSDPCLPRVSVCSTKLKSAIYGQFGPVNTCVIASLVSVASQTFVSAHALSLSQNIIGFTGHVNR